MLKRTLSVVALAVLVCACVFVTLPQRGDAATGTTRAATKASGDSIAPAAIDTTDAVLIKNLKLITVALQYDGDSATVSIDTSWDNVVWTNRVNAVVCNGAPGTLAEQYVKQLVLAQSGGSAYDPGFLGNWLRFRINNDDSATYLSDVKTVVVGE